MTPCREWAGPQNKEGYGRLTRNRRRFYVHRWVWQLANGPIPPGMVVMHICDTRLCFRLDHLRLGTHAENQADMVAKGRNVSPGGHRPRRATCRRFGHPIIEVRGHRFCPTCKDLATRRRR